MALREIERNDRAIENDAVAKKGLDARKEVSVYPLIVPPIL
jgi:hypothetical protein